MKMDKLILIGILVVCFCNHETNSLNLPGPLVYVVTPSPKPPHGDEARAAPFYYHNWMRRMDPPRNASTTTTTTQKPETPDLIFAEFESGNKIKSIRKLLEKEKVEKQTTTTKKPIYIAAESSDVSNSDYSIPVQMKPKKEDKKPVDMTDYFALYNNQYNPNSADHAPVYTPSTTSITTTTTTTSAPLQDVQNIWHIIDSEKYDQYSGKWEEEPVSNEDTKDMKADSKPTEESSKTEEHEEELDNNFALPGFATNGGNTADNESRAIRTEPSMRFPYVNLKPFQIKTAKKPLLNTISNIKKGSSGYASIDNFYDLKNPVRGESQDVVPDRQPIERYNPAQPYLPDYGTKSKQSSPTALPTKDVASLVPPPPPVPPKITDDDFPSPSSYELFPPYYVPSSPPASPPPPSPPSPPPPSVPESKPVYMYQSTVDTSDDFAPPAPPVSSSDNDDAPIDLGYRYKPPSSSVDSYSPTMPMSDSFPGYSYDKPPMMDDSPPDMDEKPDFEGYMYSKPEEPSMPADYAPASYGADMKPYGPYFPKVVYGVEDHDYKHYHYHPTTTTTTTEMPRVNRYSYYYLGKKLYYLPLYFSVYFIVYVGALIIKAVLRHKIVYPNSWRPNDQTAAFFSKRSVDSVDFSNENLHEITGRVTHAIATAGEKFFAQRKNK